MKLLLDTHCFLWLLESPQRLSPRQQTLCDDPDHDIYLSIANLWEIQIKVQLGKLSLDTPLDQIVADQVHAGPINLLMIHTGHVLELPKLPMHHKDPFDRIILCQARVEAMHLVTGDSTLRCYQSLVNLLC